MGIVARDEFLKDFRHFWPLLLPGDEIGQPGAHHGGLEPVAARQGQVGHHPTATAAVDAEARGVRARLPFEQGNQGQHIVHVATAELFLPFTTTVAAILASGHHVPPTGDASEETARPAVGPGAEGTVASPVDDQTRIGSRLAWPS